MTKERLNNLDFYITEAQDLIGRIDQLRVDLQSYVDEIVATKTKDDETIELLDKIEFDSDDMDELGRDLDKLDNRREVIARTWTEDDYIFDSEEIIDIDDDNPDLFEEGEED